MKSKCCKANAQVIETENAAYYVCTKCKHFCDVANKNTGDEKQEA